ncbi:hypothetical protein [Arthrobacter terrae]|uniref:hypothetical protein n=1 Tax=Arthrobacter terrae TaxID=2935737 RepID=UPI001E29BA7F|nr:hypothetical protein [Arthrobacter terrae]
MSQASQQVWIAINRPIAEVYAYASNPAHLPQWAAGLTGSQLVRAGDHWLADSPMGRIRIDFIGTNP